MQTEQMPGHSRMGISVSCSVLSKEVQAARARQCLLPEALGFKSLTSINEKQIIGVAIQFSPV